MSSKVKTKKVKTSKVQTTGRQKALLGVFGVVLTLLLLAVAEGLLALLGVGDQERFADPFVGFDASPTLFERVGDEYVTRPEKLAFFNAQRFPVEKEAGTLRIMALGGSTTAGRPYDDHLSFSRWLERYLDAAEPMRQHEVINAGAISYASYRVTRLMLELVRYEPDVFVVLTGHNEFLEERTYREVRQEDGARRRLRSGLSRFRLSRLAWETLAPEPEPATQLGDAVQTRLDVWNGVQAYTRDDELRRSVVAHFKDNVGRMIEIAEAHDVELIFVQPVSNLKDFSPFKSEHRDGLTPDERIRFRSAYESGVAATAGSAKAGSALAFLDEALAIDDGYAALHYARGRAFLEAGDTEAAHQAFMAAKELDVAPLRALEEVTDFVAEAAGAAGVPVIELPRLLGDANERSLGHRILGNEFLLDHVHPEVAVHSRVAEELMQVLAAAGLMGIGPEWSPRRRSEVYESVLGELDEAYYAQRDLNLGKVLGWAGKLVEAEAPLIRARQHLAGNADLHLTLGTLWQKTGRLPEAVQELERAVELVPELPEARFNLGVTYGKLRRSAEAVAELREALRLRPDYPEARHNLGVMLREAGDLEAAIAELARARSERPEAPEVHRALGVALSQAERWADAEQALGEARRLDPVDPEVYYRLGILRARTNVEEAVELYERALVLDARHVGAHTNLGILRSMAGQWEPARRHLETAAALAPSPSTYLNLGVVYENSGDLAGAERVFREGLALDPENNRLRVTLGIVLLVTGRRDEAIPYLEAARAAGHELPPTLKTVLSP